MKNTITLLTLLTLLVSLGSNAQNNAVSEYSLFNNAPQSPQALLSCAGYEAYQQPMDDANYSTARTADAEIDLTAHESMVDGGGVITPMINGNSSGLKIWGISAEFNGGFIGPCAEDDIAGTPFNLTFSDDNAGQPGNVIASVTGTVDNINDTAIPFAFTSVQEINLSFPETDMSNVSWVSVQRQAGQNAASGNQCLFLWVNETTASYDDYSQQDNAGVFAPEVYDLTMCIDQYVPPQPVPSLRWYSMLALLLAIGFFSTRLFVKARK